MSGYDVYGSCVTRDAAELGQRPLPDPERYWSRSRLQSFVAPPVAVTEHDVADLTGFAARLVLQDHTKGHRDELVASELPLLVDLIDERFRLLRTRTGSLVTWSNYFTGSALQEAGGYEQEPTDTRLAADGPFATACHAFAEVVGSRPVVIHRAMWAERDTSGVRVPGPDADAANAWLDKAYALLSDALPRATVVAVDASLRVADPGHRWGLAHFHYVPAYYDALSDAVRDVLPAVSN